MIQREANFKYFKWHSKSAGLGTAALRGAAAGGQVKCLSCHSPHGGQPGTKMNTVALAPADPSELAICQACHQRQGGD